jgi:hypothetical protein
LKNEKKNFFAERLFCSTFPCDNVGLLFAL